MMDENNLSVAAKIMEEFASRTGVASGRDEQRRYLWTDAFAVCNFIELHRRTGDEKFRELALRLVDRVHQVLGRHREDDLRSGWLSGLGEEQGKLHPTRAGLRIGKKLNERGPSDPWNERLEWDRDGQYFHYLTKWMRALNVASRTFDLPFFNRWAAELAKTAHAAFVYTPSYGEGKLMYWKMSIDLSSPLVASMGQHDPLDGYVAYSLVQATAEKNDEISEETDLSNEISEIKGILRTIRLATADPLGIGGLLCDAYTLANLFMERCISETDTLESVLSSCTRGIAEFEKSNQWKFPPDYRLAFRELGLSIGLKAWDRLRKIVETHPDRFAPDGKVARNVRELETFFDLSKAIDEFWLDPANQKVSTWKEHEDINSVMLATSLLPEGFLNVL